MDVSLDRMRFKGADAAAVHEVCDALQFRGLRTRLLALRRDRGADSDDGGAAAAHEITFSAPGSVADVVALTG